MRQFVELHRELTRWGLLALWAVCCSACFADSPATRLATVNGQPVTQRDVDLEQLLSGSRPAATAEHATALDRVIDRTLVAKFIAAKGADPLAEDVENLVLYVRTGIESGGDTVEAVLSKLQLTEDDIRQSARISVGWQAYVRRTIKEEQIRDYFEAHREQLDGTQIRISQIVRSIAAPGTPDEWTQAEKLLTNVRQQITAGTIEFTAAAVAHSTSPTAKSGGDVGFIRYQGSVPAPVAAAAFTLKVGEISAPIRSSVGVHLVQATERLEGELSLEDARPAILRVLGDELWKATVKTLRAKAKIVKD